MFKQLDRAQKEKVTQFQNFTQTSERIAQKFLKSSDWNVELAVDSYYNSSSSTKHTSTGVNERILNATFDKHREKTDAADTISANGTITYLQEIGLNLEEKTICAVSEMLKAPTIGELTRQGFVEGWKEAGCDSLDKMKRHVSHLRAEMENPESTELFNRVYEQTFYMAKNPDQKSISLSDAEAYWETLLSDRFSNLKSWLRFLHETREGKALSKDTWIQLQKFAAVSQQEPDYRTWDQPDSKYNHGAWPSIIDEFVEWHKNQMNG